MIGGLRSENNGNKCAMVGGSGGMLPQRNFEILRWGRMYQDIRRDSFQPMLDLMERNKNTEFASFEVTQLIFINHCPVPYYGDVDCSHVQSEPFLHQSLL